MTTLDQLTVGSRAAVVSVRGGDAVSLRLLEMGLVPGIGVSVVGTAPLGDPMELELRGYRLSVRRSEAALVEVKPDGECQLGENRKPTRQ